MRNSILAFLSFIATTKDPQRQIKLQNMPGEIPGPEHDHVLYSSIGLQFYANFTTDYGNWSICQIFENMYLFCF